MTRRPLELVIVDDDPSDVELLKEAVGSWRMPPSQVVTCASGEEALSYLATALPGRDRIVILDLNMPGIGGRETLRSIRREARLRGLVVIIMTTSDSGDDVRGCYEDGANSYMVKPLDFSHLMTAAKRIEDYWMETASLPRIS